MVGALPVFVGEGVGERACALRGCSAQGGGGGGRGGHALREGHRGGRDATARHAGGGTVGEREGDWVSGEGEGLRYGERAGQGLRSAVGEGHLNSESVTDEEWVPEEPRQRWAPSGRSARGARRQTKFRQNKLPLPPAVTTGRYQCVSYHWHFSLSFSPSPPLSLPLSKQKTKLHYLCTLRFELLPLETFLFVGGPLECLWGRRGAR